MYINEGKFHKSKFHKYILFYNNASVITKMPILFFEDFYF